jgi:hypothetical protein
VPSSGRLASPVVVLAVLVASFSAIALSATARAADQIVFFTTPSHGIGCVYAHPEGEGRSLRCDVLDVEHPAKRPAWCEQDYGSSFGLEPRGRAKRLCVGDTAMDPKAPVLQYGKRRHVGPFTCVSRRAGLRCTNAAGHGFDLSRQRQRLF